MRIGNYVHNEVRVAPLRATSAKIKAAYADLHDIAYTTQHKVLLALFTPEWDIAQAVGADVYAEYQGGQHAEYKE